MNKPIMSPNRRAAFNRAVLKSWECNDKRALMTLANWALGPEEI